MSISSRPIPMFDIRSEQPWFVLNSAKQFSLYPSSNPAISHYYSFELKQECKLNFAIPDGCVDVVFDCDEYKPRAMICGTPLEARNTQLIAQHRYFGVRFARGVIPDFIDVATEELIDQEFDFLETIPNSYEAFEKIVSQPSFAKQVAIFNEFLLGKRIRQPSSLTLQVVQDIYKKKGNIRIQDLEALTGYTTRTIQRQFRDDLGVSPKTFSRIIRCQSAVCDIHNNNELVFSDLACDLGFYDQSHFLSEFKKLVSTTPLDYLNRISHGTYQQRIRYL
ncbi:HTH-type transcriptional activator RhaR [Marinomonas spartinae]|uniref:HTH-type transcriptional activator RhaR n=1 Tax=Marinomonas spartinae TaxID=1792290 RepID=A0A1A8TCC9_9GAMM|nr:helix-turn-helix domain-containing protein [Marinomonas spartinae]SBS29297.1 HTH-type transcriptional activator RhaR [Marinomonas spartinae]